MHYAPAIAIINQIKSNQIKSLLLSHHHSTSALLSEILTSVLQTVQKNPATIYIWTIHIYRLYRRQCAKYTYIYSVHTVYYKDILSYQLHIIHRMCTSTLCTHLYIVLCEGATDYKFTADGCATDSCAKVQQIMHMQCHGCALYGVQ